MKRSRILVFGAGVIGSIYAGRLAMSGQDVTILARNKRLRELQEMGLLLKKNDDKKIIKAPVAIIDQLEENDKYDYVYVIIRRDQLEAALPVLRNNKSASFVFMVNTSGGYAESVNALGKSRVVAAFPGAGGKIEKGVVHYSLTSKLIQPTTIGEIDGQKSERIADIRSHLTKAGFSTAISKDMDAWQKSHVAMVCPLALGIYYDGGNNYTFAKNKEAIRQTSLALKESFSFLKQSGIRIKPPKLDVFRILPLSILNFILCYTFNTKWAETVISNHAISAREEMDLLTSEFISMAESKGFILQQLKRLAGE